VIKILGGDSHSYFPHIKDKNSWSLHICLIDTDLRVDFFCLDGAHVWHWRWLEVAVLLPTTERERPKKREVIVLLYFLVFLFFCFAQIFPSLFFFVFSSSDFQTDVPFYFSQPWKCPSVPYVFFFSTFPLFFICFFFSVFHSFLSSFPIFPSPARLSPLVFIKRKGGLLPVSSHGTGVWGWPGGHLAASPGPPAGLVPSIFLFGGRWGAWVLSGFGQVGRKRESGKNTGEQNFSFPCLCVGRGRRRIVLFKTTLFQVLFFWNNPKMSYDNIYSIQNKFVFKYKNIFFIIFLI